MAPKVSAPADDAILRAFRMSPVADTEKARGLCPELIATMEPLCDSMCVEWLSTTTAVLVAVGSCAPEDTFLMAPSVPVRSVAWVCLLHPGSTNSSKIVGSIGDAHIVIQWKLDVAVIMANLMRR